MMSCNCHALRQATRHVTQLYDRALAPSGLRATQYSLLLEVSRHGPISLIPLADILVMDRATLGHNLRPLEAAGYLEISIGRDRRSREVSLTDAGQHIMEKARPLWQKAQNVFEAKIGAAQSARLRRTLNSIATAELALERRPRRNEGSGL